MVTCLACTHPRETAAAERAWRVQFFDKWTLSQLDAADYEEAPPAPEWVVRETAAREGAARHSDYERREALEGEMPGFAGIKHHISQDEMAVRRRNSVALEDGAGVSGGSGGLGGPFSMRRRSGKGGRSSQESGPAEGDGRSAAGSTGVAAVSAAEGSVVVDVGGAMHRRSRDLPAPPGDD